MAYLALKRLHGSVLDGHTLESKPSEKRLTQQPSGKTASTSKEKNSSKLIVRNVAFQASKTEIMGLFAAFGNVKRVRIPKKMNGTHRGFAFVDFSSSQEALNAMNSLKNAHFFGRHLVLEWAKDEIEDGVTAMTELRKKANKDYRIQNEMKKRRKTEEFDEYGMKSTEEGDSFDYDMDGEEEDDES
jgi:multiple RNA-binding domain-containing protein 1